MTGEKADFSLKRLPIAGCVIRQRADSSYSTPWHLFFLADGPPPSKSLKVHATPEKEYGSHSSDPARSGVLRDLFSPGFSREQWSIAISNENLVYFKTLN
jgi:hypothetical protein